MPVARAWAFEVWAKHGCIHRRAGLTKREAQTLFRKGLAGDAPVKEMHWEVEFRVRWEGAGSPGNIDHTPTDDPRAEEFARDWTGTVYPPSPSRGSAK